MWFSNLVCYRFKQAVDYQQDEFEKALEQDKFRPCGSQDLSTFGWTNAFGKHGQMLSHFTKTSIFEHFSHSTSFLSDSVIAVLFSIWFRMMPR